MNKKKLRIDIGKEIVFDAEGYDASYTTTIDEVISFFTEAKNNGSTHIEWFNSGNYCSAQPFLEREETDEEATIRRNKEIELHKEEVAMNEIKLREQYKILKAKFEN